MNRKRLLCNMNGKLWVHKPESSSKAIVLGCLYVTGLSNVFSKNQWEYHPLDLLPAPVRLPGQIFWPKTLVQPEKKALTSPLEEEEYTIINVGDSLLEARWILHRASKEIKFNDGNSRLFQQKINEKKTKPVHFSPNCTKPVHFDWLGKNDSDMYSWARISAREQSRSNKQ